MNKSMLFSSALMGLATLWSVPALAQSAPADPSTPTTTTSTSTSTMTTQPAPASAPMAAPSPVVLSEPMGRYTTETTTTHYGHPGLVWGGVAIWGVAYSASAITGAVANDVCNSSSRLCVTGREVMFIPIAGPFIALANVNNGTGSSTMKTMLAIDGAFQIGGVAMAVTGLVLSARERHTQVTAMRKEPRLMVTPYATATSAGLGAVGHF